MLRDRLVAGLVMAGFALALVGWDRGPNYPGLLTLAGLVGAMAAAELRRLFPSAARPPGFVAVWVVLALASNWVLSPGPVGHVPQPVWPPLLLVCGAAVLTILTWEVFNYAADGQSSARAANGVFAVVYLGLLPSFLLRLRWLPDVGLWAVLATIFVPKVGDVGAYFTGRLVGRHKLAPTLSPKKTWEGFAGGLVASAGTAAGVGAAAPGLFPHGPAEAVGFGLAVGTAGVVGDLFESVLKRDAHVKDAARTLPGFGGVLDVIDSVLFAAPVAYLWFALR